MKQAVIGLSRDGDEAGSVSACEACVYHRGWGFGTERTIPTDEQTNRDRSTSRPGGPTDRQVRKWWKWWNLHSPRSPTDTIPEFLRKADVATHGMYHEDTTNVPLRVPIARTHHRMRCPTLRMGLSSLVRCSPVNPNFPNSLRPSISARSLG